MATFSHTLGQCLRQPLLQRLLQVTPLVLQVLGENAVLISALLEAAGTFARILGPSFATKGLFLRETLLLLLERLADPCPLVASSAGVALGSVCLHCGYPTRQALLASNADYLVEGLCRELRSLATHPRYASPFWSYTIHAWAMEIQI